MLQSSMNATLKKIKIKKSTFKITSSCTNMESYSHLGINQQMNHTNGESAFCLVFFQHHIFHPYIKRQVNSHSNIDRQVHGWRPFQPLVDCQKFLIDSTNRLIIDHLSGRVVHFHDWLEGFDPDDGLKESDNR